MPPKKTDDDETGEAPVVEHAEPAASGQLRVTALVSVRDLRAGETAIVADDAEWRAIVDAGFAVLS